MAVAVQEKKSVFYREADADLTLEIAAYSSEATGKVVVLLQAVVLLL